MTLPLLAVILGLILLTWSADRFVFGASALARTLGVSPLLIGLTIVAFATSAPEMMVSVLASLQGNPGLAVGNVIGSNIVNIALVLGAAVVVTPLAVATGLVRRELPILLVVSFGGYLLLLDGMLGWVEGLVLLSTLVVITVWMIVAVSRDGHGPEEVPETVHGGIQDVPEALRWTLALGWLGFGLLLLVLSSQVVVWGAVEIAEQLGVSDLLIGLTVVAIGTSLPELMTSIIAALRREMGLAIGNVIGSNLFNLLAVLAVPALIAPLPIAPEVLWRDYPVMLGLTVVLFVFASARGGQLRRWQGVALLATFVAYLTYLVWTASA